MVFQETPIWDESHETGSAIGTLNYDSKVTDERFSFGRFFFTEGFCAAQSDILDGTYKKGDDHRNFYWWLFLPPLETKTCQLLLCSCAPRRHSLWLRILSLIHFSILQFDSSFNFTAIQLQLCYNLFTARRQEPSRSTCRFSDDDDDDTRATSECCRSFFLPENFLAGKFKWA